MATFGKRVPPKHRAEPSERRNAPAPTARPGAHAAPVTPAPVDAPVIPAAPSPHTPSPNTPSPNTPSPNTPSPNTPTPAPAPELGTAMSAELPAAPVSVTEPAPPTIHTGALRVLIVDDNEDVRGLLRIALARAEIEVVGAAGDSREALAFAQHEHPGIILLDVNLPDMAGLELLPLLRDHCPQARVVMFSAQVGSNVIETAMQRGATAFIEKGVSMKHVVAHLHEVATAPEGQTVEPFPLKVHA